MKRVALTGGIACGKSRVAALLNAEGIATVDADDIVHELIPDPEERRRLAAEVFADPERLRALEARLHPIVRARIDAALAAAVRPTVAVIPLLFEKRWDEDYDIICCVRSERSAQIERMMTTRGYTREAAEARLGAQLPVDEKARRSHYVIPNDGTLAALSAEVRRFADWLKTRI